MLNDWDAISTEMVRRRNARGPLLEAMRTVRDHYNGTWVLPELGGDTISMAPTVISDAIDNHGTRAAQLMPGIIAPALDGTKPRSRDAAARRKKAWMYTWEVSELQLHLRRAYRHLFGYATTALVVEPDFDMECARIKVRDPLNCFSEPKSPEDLSPPLNCGFIYGKSADWIRKTYPNAPEWVRAENDAYGGPGLWDMVEWIDADSIVLGVLGPRLHEDSFWGDAGNMKTVELKRWPNRAGRCTVVTPQRLTMDAIASQVAKVVGMAELQARLIALDILATQKSIVPDRYIMGTSAMVPRLVGNTWKDGSTGEVNIVLDATAVGDLRGTPDPNNKITQDRLERYARQSTGQTPASYGEAVGGARTGRGILALDGASVDPRIQEAQEMMQARLTDVNHIVGDLYLGYWPDKRYTVWSGLRTDRSLVEFRPDNTFGETTENKVAYALPGADTNGLIVAIGQTVGTELMSRESARHLHPFIEDAEGEGDKILVEKMMQALEMQILTRASDPAGGFTPIDAALLVKQIQSGADLPDAMIAVDQAARERQAREAPPAPEGMALPPEMMPGLANPGEGAESQPPGAQVPGPPQGLQNLDSLLGALSAPPLG